MYIGKTRSYNNKRFY